MCEEESDDHEAVAKLFEINDSIHRTIERYKLIKKGDLEGANRIPRGTLGTSGAGVSKGPDNELSLIDFGGPEEAPISPEASAQGASTAAAAPKPRGNALEDDLLGLSMGDSTFGAGGGISLGGSSNGLLDLAGPSASTQAPQASTPQPAASAIFQQPAQAAPQQQKPNYDVFASLSQPSSKPSTPAPPVFAHQAAAVPQQQKADPFASLTSTSRSGSPFQFQQSTKPAPPQQPAVASLAGQSNGASARSSFDEWTFSSSLPEQAHDITVTNSSIKTVFHVSRPSSADNYLMIESKTSNNTAQPITDLTFQLAVTKVSSDSTKSRSL